MLVLGATAKEKGTQLEALIRTELLSQGYASVYTNVIGAGGNELDIIGEQDLGVMGTSRVIPLLCEAKAHADPVDMPTWQRFLGKLMIERVAKPATIGMLVALNGVNGNVRGSFTSIREKDDGIFVFDGNHLLDRAREAGQIAAEDAVGVAISALYRKNPSKIEAAYYGGGYFWVVWWNDDQYSISDAHGNRLSAEETEQLRDALEGSLRGNLLGADDAQALSEARHAIKVGWINSLLQGVEVQLDESDTDGDAAEVFESLLQEPYISHEDERLTLVPANELDAPGVARLFVSLFENSVPVAQLKFIAEGSHRSYVQRLVDTLSERQAGFTLSPNDEGVLREVAPLFPSVWLTLARPIPMITGPRANDPQLTSEAVLANDRNEFWEAIIQAVRQNFTNVFLRGLLYDYLNLAELEEKTQITIKSKFGVVGTMGTETRTAIRQLEEGFATEVGSKHALIRILPTIAEPWDDTHPDPMPLEGT